MDDVDELLLAERQRLAINYIKRFEPSAEERLALLALVCAPPPSLLADQRRWHEEQVALSQASA